MSAAEPNPPEPPPSSTAPPPSRFGSLILLLLGPAALVTGVFGSVDELVREHHESLVQRCQLAERLVEDDQLNAKLNDTQQRMLLDMATRQVQICIRGDRS